MATGRDQGVYRVDVRGNIDCCQAPTRFVFPNGLAFDDRGNLYVTESFSGFRRQLRSRRRLADPRGRRRGGAVGARHTADGVWASCPRAPWAPNGIRGYHGDLYVTNTRQGNGGEGRGDPRRSAGPVELWKRVGEVPESPLAGSRFPIMPDGLALDTHGNVYVTVLTRNAIVKITNPRRMARSRASPFLDCPGPCRRLRSTLRPVWRSARAGGRAAEPLRHQSRVDGEFRAGAAVARAGAGQGGCRRTGRPLHSILPPSSPKGASAPFDRERAWSRRDATAIEA